MIKHKLSDGLRSTIPFAFWPYLHWENYGAKGNDGASVGTAIETSPGTSRRPEQGGIGIDRRLEALTKRIDQFDERQTRMESLLAEIRDFMVHQRTIQEWYSPEEIAELLEKQPYTVREWCRYRRINARKRPTGRGAAQEWEISHEELDRIKSHGLLPIPTKY